MSTRLRRGSLAALCIVGLVAVFAQPWNAQAEERIRINGSGSGLAMLKPMVKAYAKAHPEVRIEMEKPLGTSGATKAILAGALDIVVSSKPLKPEDAAKGAILQDYGKTPLAIVTEKNVRKGDITTRELEEIYSGKVRKWPNGGTIRLILRPDHDVDTTILRGMSPAMNAAIDKAQAQSGMIVAVTDPESDEMVSKTAGAMGASGLTGVLSGEFPLQTLSLNGERPTTKALANGAYPLAKMIRFITTKNTPPAALRFLDFVYSPQGRAIAEKAGVLVTVPVKGGK